MKKHWFYKNPKKTVAALVFSTALALIIVAEKWFVVEQGNIAQPSSGNRSIRLREHVPNSSYEGFVAHDDEKTIDGPAKKYVRLRTDDNGFIMPSQKHDNPDLSIVFLGGSTTECWDVDEEKRFP